MKVNTGSFIREQIVKNLLRAHERIAETGSVFEVIQLTKFVSRFSKQFDNQLLDFRVEESNESAEGPPDKSEYHIPKFKSNTF